MFDSLCGIVIYSLSMAFSVYSIFPQKIKLTAISAVMLNSYSTNLWLIIPYWKCNSDRCVMKTNIFGMTFLYFKTDNKFLSNYFYKILIYTITTCNKEGCEIVNGLYSPGSTALVSLLLVSNWPEIFIVIPQTWFFEQNLLSIVLHGTPFPSS